MCVECSSNRGVRFVGEESLCAAVVPGQGDAEPGCEGRGLGAAWKWGGVLAFLSVCFEGVEGVFVLFGWGGQTYGLRGCCRRRRVLVVLVFVFGFGCGFGGLRFRIGCVRRRMSRRGGCGWVVGLPLLTMV